MSEAALALCLGNDPAKDALLLALQKNSLPHAVLLAAPNGCGRNFFARCLAADYLYPEGGPPAAAVLRGESPEVLLVEGEGPSGQIKIDRVRQVRGDIYHTGLSAAGRVVLIRDAERMMAPAANALLKVLEEPPGEVLFILTARDATALPATIRSRCAAYPLAEVSLSACEEVLRQAGGEESEAQFLAAVYGGRIGLCLRALQSETRRATLDDALKAACAAAKKDRYALLCLFSQYEGRGDEERGRRFDFLADLSSVLASALRAAPSVETTGVSPPQAACFLPHVQAVQQALQGNASPKLTFTALAVKLTKEAI